MEDRDYTRFLWIFAFVTYWFAMALFGSTLSPFIMQATMNFHLIRSQSSLKALLMKSFVDNIQGTMQ